MPQSIPAWRRAPRIIPAGPGAARPAPGIVQDGIGRRIQCTGKPARDRRWSDDRGPGA